MGHILLCGTVVTCIALVQVQDLVAFPKTALCLTYLASQLSKRELWENESRVKFCKGNVSHNAYLFPLYFTRTLHICFSPACCAEAMPTARKVPVSSVQWAQRKFG